MMDWVPGWNDSDGYWTLFAGGAYAGCIMRLPDGRWAATLARGRTEFLNCKAAAKGRLETLARRAL